MCVYTTDVSPGVMDGDRYRSEWNLDKKAHVILGSTSALRLHPTPYLPSAVEQSFQLAGGAVLEYFPECIIPFRGSSCMTNTIFHLGPDAVLAYGEIWSAGRIHHGEVYAFSSYKSATEIWRGPDLVAWDSFVLAPGSGFSPHGGPAAMMDYTHTAALWIVAEGLGKPELDAIDNILEAAPPVLAGASTLAGQSGIIVRMLGYSAEELQQCSLAVWNVLRPIVIGKPPLRLRK
ncbi:urease accessory protein UreD [Fontibacillus sp. BL9]|uniref:urease accessory protein UreD n=1 Tax=Fontibacillus sp. BL9 TaxID=3389971 RepID=UPI00397B53C7